MARLAALIGLFMALAYPPDTLAQDAVDYFRLNCASCHTIGGGRLTGPDLKDVTARRDHAWLLRYIPDPKATIDGGIPSPSSCSRKRAACSCRRCPRRRPRWSTR
jgi:mono/diheme cytochrome c family protein